MEKLTKNCYVEELKDIRNKLNDFIDSFRHNKINYHKEIAQKLRFFYCDKGIAPSFLQILSEEFGFDVKVFINYTVNERIEKGLLPKEFAEGLLFEQVNNVMIWFEDGAELIDIFIALDRKEITSNDIQYSYKNIIESIANKTENTLLEKEQDENQILIYSNLLIGDLPIIQRVIFDTGLASIQLIDHLIDFIENGRASKFICSKLVANDKSKKIKKISSIEELLAWLKHIEQEKRFKCSDFIYRGQSDAAWFLKSGAVRRVQGREKTLTAEYPSPKEIEDYIQDLVNNAKVHGLEFHGTSGGECCDLKILAELQHHGAATNLLDFSKNILVALWMACNEFPDKDGKIFAIDLLTDKIDAPLTGESKSVPQGEFEELNIDEVKKITIHQLFEKPRPQVWTPERFVSRIQSQASVFLVARNESQLYCHEIIIDKAKKREILQKLLTRFALSEVQVYPDLPGFAKANRAELPGHMQSENYYMSKAHHFARLKNSDETIRFLEKAKGVAPKNPQIYLQCGFLKSQLNILGGAREDYDNAININPQYADAYNSRGNLKIRQLDFQGAVDDYSKAIELCPGVAGFYYNRGKLKREQGCLSEAREDYDKAIEVDPYFVEAYDNRGVLRADQGDLNGAREDFDKAIESNPQFANAYNSRGMLNAYQGDLSGARNDYDKAIELNPNCAEVYNNRGNLRADQNDLLGAREDYDKAINLNPYFVAAYDHRGSLRKQSDPKGARDDYDKAIELNPQYASAYNNRGILKDESGDQAGALVDFNKAIEFNSENPFFYINRGDFYRHTDKFDDALEDFNKAILLKTSFLRVYILKALTLEKLSKKQEAIDCCKEYCRLCPNDPNGIVLLERLQDA